jgi:hypothetical protein
VLFFLLLHLAAAVLAPLLVRWWGRQAFLALALVPAAAFAWFLAQLAAVTGGREVRETTPWIPTLDLDIALRLDPLALAFALVVTGVGALVLVYCARYFEPGDDGIGRFVPLARVNKTIALQHGSALILHVEGVTSGFGGTFLVNRSRDGAAEVHFTVHEIPGNTGINPNASPTNVPTVRAYAFADVAADTVVTSDASGDHVHRVLTVSPAEAVPGR